MINLFQIIRDGLDFYKKNKEVVKSALIILFVIVISLTLMNTSCEKKKSEKIQKENYELKLKNAKLDGEIAFLDKNIISFKKMNDSLDVILTKKQKDYDDLNDKYLNTKKKYDDIIKDLSKKTAEESYDFLVNIAYPFMGEMKFKFNEPQVKGIHATYLQHENLLRQNLFLIYKNETLNNMYDICEEKNNNNKVIISDTEEKYEKCEEKNKNNEQQVTNLEKENKKLEKKKKFWRGTSGVSATVAVILALLLL